MRYLVIMYYGSLLSEWHNRLRIGAALSFTLVYSQLMPLVHNTIRYTCNSPTCTEMYADIHVLLWKSLGLYVPVGYTYIYMYVRNCGFIRGGLLTLLYCVVFHRLAWRRRHIIC